MRAIWKGAVSFGLVSVPVKLYSATESHDVSLHLRDRGAVIEIGAGTFINHRSELVAHERVRIGRDCLLAWDVLVLDSDSHAVDGGPRSAPVTIPPCRARARSCSRVR